MPLFGLIKKKQSTFPLSSNRRRTSASSSSAAHEAQNISAPPPRSSSLSPPQLPPPPSSSSLTLSSPNPAANTTPPSRPRRTGGGRPSLEAIEPFGLSSPSSGNNTPVRIPHQQSTSPIPSSSQTHTSPSYAKPDPTGYQLPNDIVGTTSAGPEIGPDSLSLLDDDDRSLARPRPSPTRTPVGEEEDDIVFIPPSRSTVFGMYEHTLNRRSGYSTQSLPDDAFTSGASSLKGGRVRAARNGNIQRPTLATRQATATDVGAVDASERRRGGGGITNTASNPNPQGSPGPKSKVFGWFSFRSSKTIGASSVVVTTPPPPPPHLPDGDIAERVKRLPLSPPHSPSSPAATSNATRARPQRPSLSPLVGADADDSGSFKVTNFRHVSPASTSSSGHLLRGGGDSSGNGAKKRTKSASSFASATSRKAKSSKQQETPQLSPPKPNIPTPALPSPKLSFFNSTSSTSLAQQQEPPSPTSPFNNNNPPSSMPPPGAPRIRSRDDSMTSETGSQRVTAAAFRQAAQARKNSMSFGGGSPLLVPTQLVNASPSSPSIQAQSHGRTSVDSLFHLPPVGATASGPRSQTPTSMTRGGNGNGGSSSPMPSPTATSFKSGVGRIRDKESPTSSSARTFVPGHTRSRSSTSDLSRPTTTTANEDSNTHTGSTSQTSLSDFANMTARLNGAAKGNAPSTSDSALNENTEMGIGGLGRQDTITQRSVGVTVLPAWRSAPPPVNVNARGASATGATAGSNTSVPGSTPSPLPPASLPTAAATARLHQVPGATKLGPSASARAFQPPRSQSALGSYARSPASRSNPVIGSVSSLHSNTARPTTIAALSQPDVDSDTSESSSEVDSDESDDSQDNAPLQRPAQPRPPRPGTSMSTRTTATAKTRLSVPLNADNVGQSGLPRPAQPQSTAADTATATGSGGNGTTARMSQARSSTMPVAPLVSLAGKTISQTSRPAASPNSASSTTSFKKPIHPNASRSVDALNFPSSASSPSPPPAQRHSANALQLHHQPQGPFAFAAAANGSVLRMDGTPSPASSSIGDSSSGKLPVTPRDGSELGWNSHAHPNATTRRRSNTMAGSVAGDSTLRPHMARSELGNRVGGPTSISTAKHGGHGHVKRHSVTFDESGMKDKGVRGILKDTSTAGAAEDQRMERRRSEARAAIELGNVVNGPPPVIDDDPDILSRLSSLQMQQRQQQQQIGLGAPMNWDQWRISQFGMSPGQPGSPASPFGIVPQPPINADPAFLAAHQQAMLIAKQAYQVAVAQQAMAAANDEWERSSNVTGFTRAGGGAPPSIYGTSSVYGMNMNMPMGMGMGMPMMGMGMGMTMPSMFPAPPASMYAGDEASVVGSTGGAGWGSASVYGASFTGPARFPGNRRIVSGNNLDTGSTLGNKSTGGLNRPTRPRTRTSPSAGAGANPIAAHAARTAAANSHSVAPTSWRRPS